MVYRRPRPTVGPQDEQREAKLERLRELLAELPADTQIVLYCKAGARSGRCLEAVRAAGRTDAVHLGGGIDAWITEIEPDQARY